MKRDEKRRAAAGSARAKLAAYEREQKGKRALVVRLTIIVVLILVCVGALFFVQSSLDDEWFGISSDAAWCATTKKWDELEALLDEDFRLDAPTALDRKGLIQLLKDENDPTLSIFATRPHDWTTNGGGHDVKFWLVASRGNLTKRSTIPLVRTWLVEARIVRNGGHWAFERAFAREAISQPR